MPDDTLQKVVDLIRAEPYSAGGLGLYALVSTLKMESSGYMYTLRKLRELDAGQRQLAYALMELMATQGNCGEDWDAATQAMDNAVRSC